MGVSELFALKTVVLLVLVLTLKSSPNVAQRNSRGNNPQFNKSREALHGTGFDVRIIGGKSVDITEFPYQAAIEIYGVLFCGGAILSEKHVITAAHCCQDKPRHALKVRVGTTLRGQGGIVRAISEIFYDPNWGLQAINHDVAVLKLKEKIPLTGRTQPIELPPKDMNVWPGKKATVTGWGVMQEDQTMRDAPMILQAVDLQIMELRTCGERYPGMVINDLVLCVGSYSWDRDSCQGDSGGPLVMDNMLIGLVSYGDGCAHQRTPAVYTNVAAVRGFIDSCLQQ